MKYLNQIIVLQKHLWELNEEANRLARLRNGAESDEVNSELSVRIGRITDERVEMIGAMGLLRLTELQDVRDKLYEALPSGEVSAFDLIKIIKVHIGRLDNIIDESEKDTAFIDAHCKIMTCRMRPECVKKGRTCAAINNIPNMGADIGKVN